MTARRPLDDKRKHIFLSVLRQTGSVSAAAAAATPHSDGGKEAYRAGYPSCSGWPSGSAQLGH